MGTNRRNMLQAAMSGQIAAKPKKNVQVDDKLRKVGPFGAVESTFKELDRKRQDAEAEAARLTEELRELRESGASASNPELEGKLEAALHEIESLKAQANEGVREVDPSAIIDLRPADRLDIEGIEDLADNIRLNGQIVPILLRPHPDAEDQYLLVYGRRRWEAIKHLNDGRTVRALISDMDETQAIRAQVSENADRMDQTFIEVSFMANTLREAEIGTQRDIASILNIDEHEVSKRLKIVRTIGTEILRRIGRCPNTGRPAWEKASKLVSSMIEQEMVSEAQIIEWLDGYEVGEGQTKDHPSNLRFAAMMQWLESIQTGQTDSPVADKPSLSVREVVVGDQSLGSIKANDRQFTLILRKKNSGFAAWMNAHAEEVLESAYTRFIEDTHNEAEEEGSTN